MNATRTNVTATTASRTTTPRTAGTSAHSVEQTTIRLGDRVLEVITWAPALDRRLERAGITREEHIATRVGFHTTALERQREEDAEAGTARPGAAPADRCRRIVERLAETTGEAWTFGYIGNLDHDRDDRAWYAFRPHPGRVGTSADRIGGHGTDELGRLADVLAGALRMAGMMAGRS